MATPILKLFLLFLFCPILSIHAIYFSVCDCSKPTTKGLLDLKDPYYCKTTPITHGSASRTDYSLITRLKPSLKWKAYTCSQWVKTKRIIGSFWIGSYDTTYLHDSKFVEPADCWNMVQNFKCGGNIMIKSGSTYTFSREPTGDGKWYATREYTTLNCLAEEITMTQESPNEPIHSPFGYHNVSIRDEKLIFNHNTVVWQTPQPKNVTCNTQTLLEGNGQLSLAKGQLKGRLLDDSKQVEILFIKEMVNICKAGVVPQLEGFSIIGIPDTFLVIPSPTALEITHTGNKTKRSTRPEITFDHSKETDVENTFNSLLTEPLFNFNQRLYHMSYAWGTIRNYENGLYLTFYRPGIWMKVADLLPDLPETNKERQKFIHFIDQSIRKENSTICVTTNPDQYVITEECSDNSSHWIYDAANKQLIETKSLKCITINSDGDVFLTNCDRPPVSSLQMWEFEDLNNNQEIAELYPAMTIDDLEYVKREFQGTQSTIYFSDRKNDTIDWGKFYNGRVTANLCVTSSVDPLDKILVLPCEPSSVYQQFKYLRDSAIRKLNSDLCIHSYHNNATLRPCDNRSQKFAKDSQTAQFVEMRTKKCLQNFRGQLELGLSNQKSTQQWQFKFYNQALFNTVEVPVMTKHQIIGINKSFARTV